jgi:hypothetical protein
MNGVRKLLGKDALAAAESAMLKLWNGKGADRKGCRTEPGLLYPWHWLSRSAQGLRREEGYPEPWLQKRVPGPECHADLPYVTGFPDRWRFRLAVKGVETDAGVEYEAEVYYAGTLLVPARMAYPTRADAQMAAETFLESWLRRSYEQLFPTFYAIRRYDDQT